VWSPRFSNSDILFPLPFLLFPLLLPAVIQHPPVSPALLLFRQSGLVEFSERRRHFSLYPINRHIDMRPVMFTRCFPCRPPLFSPSPDPFNKLLLGHFDICLTGSFPQRVPSPVSITYPMRTLTSAVLAGTSTSIVFSSLFQERSSWL